MKKITKRVSTVLLVVALALGMCTFMKPVKTLALPICGCDNPNITRWRGGDGGKNLVSRCYNCHWYNVIENFYK